MVSKILSKIFGSRNERLVKRLLKEVDKITALEDEVSSLSDDEIAEYPTEFDLNAALSHCPDAVIIANPTAFHLDIAIPAAKQGCHLFIEKPINHTLDRIDALLRAVGIGRGKVFTAFQFRFHPGLNKINALIDYQGLQRTKSQPSAIGRPLSFRVQWGEYLPSWHPWEDYRKGYSARAELGGGVVLTLSHPFDYLRWFFGEVESLWAFTGKSSDLEVNVEDTAEIGLRFENGVIGSVHLDYVQRPPVHMLEIIGTKGTIRWNSSDGDVWVYSDDSGVATYPAPPKFERNELFLAEMQHFIEVVQGKVEPLCTLDDGIKALEIALGVHESALEGQMIKF